jgi:predicted NBD/HSP70 family sugar kinase
METLLACVEIGGGGAETVVFDGVPRYTVIDGAHQPSGAGLALAVPGIIEGERVVAATNLGWFDVDPVAQLGLRGPAAVVLNDAHAAALGESVLRDAADVVYVGLGTGVGGAVVADGRVVADNLFGHAQGFSDDECRCGKVGCLETVAAGWALPRPVAGHNIARIAFAVGRAILGEPAARDGFVVVGGGLARAYPELVAAIASELGDRPVEPSNAPTDAKSAAAWGLANAAGYVNVGGR